MMLLPATSLGASSVWAEKVGGWVHLKRVINGHRKQCSHFTGPPVLVFKANFSARAG